MRLIRWVVAPTLLFAILILGAEAVGHRQTPPKSLELLHLTECALPCWMGITPGKTGFDDALRLVKTAYSPQDVTVQETQIFAGYLIGRSSGAASIQLAAGTVNTMFLLTFDVGELTIGDTALLFGTPSCILNHSPLVLMYRSPNAYALVVADGGSGARWRQPLNSIEIHSLSDADQSILCAIARR